MANKDFDKIFRDKLSGHATPVDWGVWRSIEAGLDGRPGGSSDGRSGSSPEGRKAAPVGLWRKAAAAGKWRRAAVYVAGAVAAAVVVVAVLLTTDDKSQLPIKTIDAGLSKLVAQTASAEQAEAQAPVLQPEKTFQAVVAQTVVAQTVAAQTAATQADAVSVVVRSSEAAVSEAATDEAFESVAAAQKSAVDQKSEIVGKSEAAETSVIAEADDMPAMVGLPPIVRKMRSFSLFSNIAPRTDITAFSNHYGVMASSGISHSSSELQSMEIISQAEHSLPLNLGLQVQFEIGEKISAGVGLSYTWLRSRYEALVNKKYHNVKQSLHYIGVPMNFYFSIMQNSRLKFYANAGGAIEKGIKASYRLKSYDGTSRSATAGIEGFQYSANFGLGLEYRFSNPCGIYLEPNAVYFFDSKVPASVRTDQPFQLKAEIGFRFHL